MASTSVPSGRLLLRIDAALPFSQSFCPGQKTTEFRQLLFAAVVEYCERGGTNQRSTPTTIFGSARIPCIGFYVTGTNLALFPVPEQHTGPRGSSILTGDAMRISSCPGAIDTETIHPCTIIIMARLGVLPMRALTCVLVSSSMGAFGWRRRVTRVSCNRVSGNKRVSATLA